MSKIQTAKLGVKLDGKSTIEVNTLINMLTHYVLITERANAIMGQGEYRSEVKVNALKEGSFDISLEVVTTWLEHLLSKENIEYASAVATAIGGVFSIYKYCKGKKVTKDEAQKVINNNLDVQTIINIYNDPKTRDGLRKSVETANNDPNVSGITLEVDGKKVATIKEEEFGELMIPDDEPLPEEKVIHDDNAILSIISLSFKRGDDWNFIYNGNKIKVRLTDDGVQKAIDEGASFAKGDALKVELEIVQKWNNEYKTYMNHRYKIKAVKEHMRTPQRQELFE